ncbi:MAG: hypothetical protein ACJ70O_00235 [Nitrososphaera sp.]
MHNNQDTHIAKLNNSGQDGYDNVLPKCELCGFLLYVTIAKYER